jgi:hypothetical protein
LGFEFAKIPIRKIFVSTELRNRWIAVEFTT